MTVVPTTTQEHFVVTSHAARPLLELVRRHLQASPHKLALSDATGDFTYQEFAARVESLSAALRKYRVAEGEIVAILLPPSALSVCTAIAVWHVGGALMLLDPSQPTRRRDQLIQDSGIRLSIVADDATGGIQVHEHGAWTAPAEIAPGDELAYVVYTSGSTGLPKGVLCRHSSLMTIVKMNQHLIGLRVDDRIAMLAPPHVEAAIYEIIAALTSGASLHIPSEGQRGPGPQCDRFLTDHAITMLVATPSRLRVMDPAQYPALRVAISAGEDLPLQVAYAWSRNRLLINSYGVSEATIATTAIAITPDAERISIGRPLEGCCVAVLDDRLRPVVSGTRGELFIGGSGVAVGYLNQPELTAHHFVDIGGQRMYRTGDFVTQDSTGLLFFHGRADEQVQIGGYRVELGEIRAVLQTHPAVHDGVICVEDNHRLVAYIAAHDPPPSGEQVRAWLVDRLPQYMVPTLYRMVERLPQTAWGKIDARALATTGITTTASTANAQSPTTTQRRLTEVSCKLLAVPEVGADDDLFLLGMTSILAATLITTIVQEFGVELSAVDVFQSPTITELSKMVDHAPQNR